MRVLVAEDVPAQRMILARLIKSAGHEVAQAENGEVALRLFSESEFECVVTDWQMPVIDGIELCRRIREIPKNHHVHLMMVTGADGNEDVLQALAAGADDFIRKPINYAEIAARLKNAQRQQEIYATLARNFAEQLALKESLGSKDAVYRDLFAKTPDPMLSLDDAWQIQEANEAWCRSFGWRPDDVRGRALDQFVVEASKKDLSIFQQRMTAGPDAPEVALNLKHRQSEVREVQVSGSRMIGTADVPTRVILRMLDVTESRRVQAQVLEHEKMAMVGGLVNGVVQEVNGPLSMVWSTLGALDKYGARLIETLNGYQPLEEIVAQADVEGAADALEAVRRRHRSLKIDFIATDFSHLISRGRELTDRARRIISDIGTVTRSDDEMAETDLVDAIQSAVGLSQAILRDRIELVRELPASAKIRGNHARLTQVFTNLIKNAVDAIPAGRAGRVKVAVTIDDTRAHATVADDGAGIAPENMSRIFDPFFTTKKSGEGVGLGLTVAFSIVKSHNGTIFAESPPGLGTTFHVEFPALAPVPAVAAT